MKYREIAGEQLKEVKRKRDTMIAIREYVVDLTDMINFDIEEEN